MQALYNRRSHKNGYPEYKISRTFRSRSARILFCAWVDFSLFSWLTAFSYTCVIALHGLGQLIQANFSKSHSSKPGLDPWARSRMRVKKPVVAFCPRIQGCPHQMPVRYPRAPNRLNRKIDRNNIHERLIKTG
jgi:hypothetical protein